MTVYGILGGIGSGKTLAMVHLARQDSIMRGKKILTNIRMDIKNAEMISPSMMDSLPSGLRNTTMCIDEIHNFMDSRSAAKKNVKKRTHFILQSRHAGEGLLDIIFTTQFMHQVDKRLRDNCDVKIYPKILHRDKDGKPIYMMLLYEFFMEHKKRTVTEYFVCEDLCDMYDTHEIVELDE